MTRLESCPGCGDDLDVLDEPDATVRCGFCGTVSRLDVDADLGSDGQFVDASRLVIVGTDAGPWAVAWAQNLNQECHEAVDDFSPSGRARWDRASAAREELIDLMFERVHGARISSALVSSDNLAAIPVGIRRPWGFAAYRDGLD